jgi:hypothetical protein
MVQTIALFVSKTMKIITSLIAHIRKRYGGKFVIDVAFLE